MHAAPLATLPAAPPAGPRRAAHRSAPRRRPTGLESNPYFSAGFGLGILGTGLAMLRGGGKGALTLAQRHLLVTLEVTSKDRAYPWVLHWLTEQARNAGSSGAPLAQHVSVDTILERLANGATRTRFEFVPCPGRHVVRYRGSLLMVDRVREQQTIDLNTGQPWESVKLTAMGRSRSVFEDLLHEACPPPSPPPP